MTALTGALLAVTACAGVSFIARGVIGTPERLVESSATADRASVLRRVGPALGVGIVVWLLTWWPMAGASAGAIAATVPILLDARRQRDADLDRLDAVASWAEMLRDTMASHAGLLQAITLTAPVAPTPIRHEVRALALRCQRVPLPDALRQFAADMDDASADLVVAALVIAEEHQAQNLSTLLGEIADSCRRLAATRMRIEASRARTYTSARSIVAITLALAAGLVVLTPDFVAPYDTATGQLVLALVGGLFAGAVYGLVTLSRPAPLPRLLAGIEADRR